MPLGVEERVMIQETTKAEINKVARIRILETMVMTKVMKETETCLCRLVVHPLEMEAEAEVETEMEVVAEVGRVIL